MLKEIGSGETLRKAPEPLFISMGLQIVLVLSY